MSSIGITKSTSGNHTTSFSGIAPRPTGNSGKTLEEVNTRKTLRMVWTPTNTQTQNSPHRRVLNLGKHETSSGSDYARYKRQSATMKNYDDLKN